MSFFGKISIFINSVNFDKNDKSNVILV